MITPSICGWLTGYPNVGHPRRAIGRREHVHGRYERTAANRLAGPVALQVHQIRIVLRAERLGVAVRVAVRVCCRWPFLARRQRRRRRRGCGRPILSRPLATDAARPAFGGHRVRDPARVFVDEHVPGLHGRVAASVHFGRDGAVRVAEHAVLKGRPAVLAAAQERVTSTVAGQVRRRRLAVHRSGAQELGPRIGDDVLQTGTTKQNAGTRGQVRLGRARLSGRAK